MKMLLTIIYIALMTHAAVASDFNVIINNGSNIVSDGLTKEQLKSLYLGYQLYLKGQRVRLVHSDLKSEAMSKFTSVVLGMNSREFSAYWRRKLFSGKGIPPREFDDQQDLVAFIKKNDNTIGVLGNPGPLSAPILILPSESISVFPSKNSSLANN